MHSIICKQFSTEIIKNLDLQFATDVVGSVDWAFYLQDLVLSLDRHVQNGVELAGTNLNSSALIHSGT